MSVCCLFFMLLLVFSFFCYMINTSEVAKLRKQTNDFLVLILLHGFVCFYMENEYLSLC
jgi:hypothetical protein